MKSLKAVVLSPFHLRINSISSFLFIESVHVNHLALYGGYNYGYN
jgi:hypothetical protein